MDFTNKTSIVTGAASGMGLLFSKCFADLGSNVVMCDVNKERLYKETDEINKNSKGKAMANMKTLLGRAAEPQEIIDLCLFVASHKGQFINGENILIDGGRNAMKRG